MGSSYTTLTLFIFGTTHFSAWRSLKTSRDGWAEASQFLSGTTTAATAGRFWDTPRRFGGSAATKSRRDRWCGCTARGADNSDTDRVRGVLHSHTSGRSRGTGSTRCLPLASSQRPGSSDLRGTPARG